MIAIKGSPNTSSRRQKLIIALIVLGLTVSSPQLELEEGGNKTANGGKLSQKLLDEIYKDAVEMVSTKLNLLYGKKRVLSCTQIDSVCGFVSPMISHKLQAWQLTSIKIILFDKRILFLVPIPRFDSRWKCSSKELGTKHIN